MDLWNSFDLIMAIEKDRISSPDYKNFFVTFKTLIFFIS